MGITAEGKIGILLALVFGVAGAAMMVWSTHLVVGWAVMSLSWLGIVLLAGHHFFGWWTDAYRSPRHIQTATHFELWEAACIIAGAHFQRPVAPGDPFMALEHLRRAFDRGELKVILTPQQKLVIGHARAVTQIGGGVAPEPLDDRLKITRETLVSYLERTGQKVRGLNG